MKKYLLFAFLIIILPLFAFSPVKSFTLKWGPELEGSRSGSITSVKGYDDTGYYITGYKSGDNYLYKINKKLDNIGEFKFEEKDPDTKIKYQYVGIRYVDNKLYLFKSSDNRKEKIIELFCQEIDKNTLKLIGKNKKIADLTYESSGDKGSFSIYTSGNLETGLSDDKLMVLTSIPSEKKENEKYNVVMCDNSINVIWKKNFQLPYASTLFTGQILKIDSKGNLYYLGKLYKDKWKEEVKGKQNYSYHLLAYTNNGEDKVDYEIKLQDKFISDITFTIKDDENIIAAGFFSKKNADKADGAFYLVLNSKTKETISSSFKEFDLDFLTQGMSEKEEKKVRKKDEKGDDQELLNYNLHNLVKRDDGGVILVGEHYFVSSHTTFDGKRYSTVNYYHYKNIVIINIDPSGKIEWAQTIPKHQRSTGDGGYYLSFALSVNGDKLRFIYNDNPKNLKPKKQGAIEDYSSGDKDGIVTMATVDKDGKVSLEALIKDSDIEVIIRPNVCDQINDNEMLLFGEKKRKDQFAILSFQDPK